MKLPGLVERVLSGAGVHHQHHLVGGARIELAQHAPDLLQFLHQVRLGVQAPGGIGDKDIDAARPGRFHGVVDDGGRIGALLLGDDRHAVALAPGLQLLHGGGAKGITGGEHDRAAVLAQAMGQFADGGGLAGAVDADHEDDIGTRFPRYHERHADGFEDRPHVLMQGVHQRLGIAQFLARDALP